MKRGFTLIELLAVIVILAIIALIAVPIVINIINDTKESSEEESLKLYEDAVNKVIVKKQMTDPTFNPSECKIKEDGNLKCTIGITDVDIEVELKGKKPNKGIVTIEGNKMSLKNVELNGKKYYETYATLLEDTGITGLSIGDKYSYKVNGKDTFTFYVLSIEENKVNLIMDRNICLDGTTDYENDQDSNYCRYAWGSTNGKGPIDAMTTLGNGTRNWNNVPNINLDYDDIADSTSSGYTYSTTYGYTGITITNGVGYITNKDGTTQTSITLIDNMTIKARLPKLKEITDAGCHIYSSEDDYGTCPEWLMGNMTYDGEKYLINHNEESYQNRIYGYWLLSSFPVLSDRACYVDFNGYVLSGSAYRSIYYGLRPVITVLMSDLS